MTIRLFLKATTKFAMGLLLTGVLLFLPAGTFRYPNAWLFIGALFVPVLGVGIVLMLKKPELLEKRLQTKETNKEQGVVVMLSGLMFVVGFVLAALDFRFSWLPLPKCIPYIALAVFVLAFLIYVEVIRENAYLSRIVEVQAGQKVIDTGLYGIVRHPMYSATVLLFLSIPFILGSLISFGAFLFYPYIITKRIRGEEAVLETELDGYRAYKQRVRYRLLPFIW